MLAIRIFRSSCTSSESLKYFGSSKFFQRYIKCTLLLPANNSTINNKLYSNDSASSDFRRQAIDLETLKGQEVIKDVIYKKRKKLTEKTDALVTDIRIKKLRVKQKVEEVIEKENIFTIPNALTLGRGVLAPYVGYVIFQGDYSLAMVLLGVAALTDLLDGQIARKWPMQASKFGSFMDPLADKLLICSLVVSMGYCNLLPIWLSGSMIIKDVLLIGAGFVIRFISLPPPKTFTRYFDATHVTAQLEPTFISKINTTIQLITIGLSLGAPIWNYMDHVGLQGLWYLTGITTAAAAISYIKYKNTFKILKRTKS